MREQNGQLRIGGFSFLRPPVQRRSRGLAQLAGHLRHGAHFFSSPFHGTTENRIGGTDQRRVAAASDSDLHRLGKRSGPRKHQARGDGLSAETTFGNNRGLAKGPSARLSAARRAAALFLFACVATARADCLDDAARYWNIPPDLARSIAMQESSMRPGVITKNQNGSRDIGLMQINSSWLPTLRRYGIYETDLLDGCKNAYVGNWILASNIQRLGFNWDAIGAYNAKSPDKRDIYARKIYRQLLAVQAGKASLLSR
jgi:soluble lytic murein transglycosylase-like protein